MRKIDNTVEMNIPIDAVQPIYSFEQKIVAAFNKAEIHGGITGIGIYRAIYEIAKEQPKAIINSANLLNSIGSDTIKDKIMPILFSKKAQEVSEMEEALALLSYVYMDFEKEDKQGARVMELLETTDMVGGSMWELFSNYYKKDICKLLAELHSGLDMALNALQVEEFLGNRGLSIRDIGSEEL